MSLEYGCGGTRDSHGTMPCEMGTVDVVKCHLEFGQLEYVALSFSTGAEGSKGESVKGLHESILR